MTLSQLYRKAKFDLTEAEIDSPQFDAMCLMEHYFAINRPALSVMGGNIADEEKEKLFLEGVKKRALGFPLQYIIGKWTFMDIPFLVGEGVLIPRDDTEVLVREALKRIEDIRSPKIIDLCSGSGTIAVTVAKARPDAEVIAIELSEQAFGYLEKNIEINKCKNITVIKGDIFKAFNDFADYSFDMVMSNPPYIKTDVIETLSKEVRHEPGLALDGGNDGMIFYNAIAENWLVKIKRGGLIALEIGEDLTDEIVALLKKNSVCDISVFKDMAELDRAIFGTV